jgi:PAS domain-containing protein
VEDKAGTGPAQPPGAERSGIEWAARVQRLEGEIDGLRRAMRSRAVIEQAKGFLSAALSCGLDEAFGHLVRLSQHENLRVAEVAARIIGAAVPTGAGEESVPQVDARLFDPLTYLHGAPASAPAAEEPPDSVDLAVLPAEVRIRLQTAAAAIQSAQTPTELADRLLDEGVGWLGAEAAMIWTTEPDGALSLAACAGLPPQVASDWQRIPSRVRVPVRDAITRDEPVWLDGEQPHDYDIMRQGASAASLPLRHEGAPFAGLVVLWGEPRPYPDTERRYLAALAALAGRRFRRLQRTFGSGSAPGHWLQGVLDALPVATFLLAPVKDEGGTLVDFMIDYASPRSGEPYGQIPADLVGRRLLDVRPQLANSGVFDAYRQVALAGGAWQRPARPEVMLIDGKPEHRVVTRSAIRLGDGLLCTWRVHDVEAQLARVSRMEELGGLGYVEWDLISGDVYWSPGLYRLFDRSPQRGPLSLDQLTDHVVAEDLPILENDLRTVLERHLPVEILVRLRLPTGERPIRAVVQPVLDRNGELVTLYALVQDLGELLRQAEAQRRGEHAANARRIHGASPHAATGSGG